MGQFDGLAPEMREIVRRGLVSELERLNTLLSELDSPARRLGRPKLSSAPPSNRGGARTLTPAARKRISDAQKTRWANKRAQALGQASSVDITPSEPPPGPPEGVSSPHTRGRTRTRTNKAK